MSMLDMSHWHVGHSAAGGQFWDVVTESVVVTATGGLTLVLALKLALPLVFMSGTFAVWTLGRGGLVGSTLPPVRDRT